MEQFSVLFPRKVLDNKLKSIILEVTNINCGKQETIYKFFCNCLVTDDYIHKCYRNFSIFKNASKMKNHATPLQVIKKSIPIHVYRETKLKSFTYNCYAAQYKIRQVHATYKKIAEDKSLFIVLSVRCVPPST